MEGTLKWSRQQFESNLVSEREASEFIDRLSSSQHILGAHVNLGWSVQRSFLKSFALKVASTGARSLEVEGVIPANYRLHHIENGRRPFADAINSERLGIIKLFNYPRPLAQHAFINKAPTYYGLQFEQSPTEDDTNWLVVIDELKDFWKKVGNGLRPLPLIDALRKLDLKSGKQGAGAVAAVSFY